MDAEGCGEPLEHLCFWYWYLDGGESWVGLEAGISLGGWEVIRDRGWFLYSNGQGHPR